MLDAFQLPGVLIATHDLEQARAWDRAGVLVAALAIALAGRAARAARAGRVIDP